MNKHPKTSQPYAGTFDNLVADKYPAKEFKYVGQKSPEKDRRACQGLRSG